MRSFYRGIGIIMAMMGFPFALGVLIGALLGRGTPVTILFVIAILIVISGLSILGSNQEGVD